MKKRSIVHGIVTLLALGLLAMGGCAADTMRGYIGQDVRAVELQYGPPVNQIDMGNGVRAYQWRKVSTDTTPVSSFTTTEKDKRGRKYSTTQYTGGETTVTNCLYTFMTSWNPARNAWIVTGFRQPSLDCAVGDLS